MKTIQVNNEIIQEARNIVDGAYDPLRGFLKKGDLLSVLDNMRLLSGEVWPMPILLDITKYTAEKIKGEKSVRLVGNEREDVVISDVEIFSFDKVYLAKKLFGTNDGNHAGVAKIMNAGDYFIGGNIIAALLDKSHEFYFTPKETKEIFRKKNWKQVAAFQTRNPPHRAHEHIQKKALDSVHGLFINPVIGPKKIGDFSDQHILSAYKIFIEKYHPAEKVHLGTFHTFMRYAGPKEALFHALVRRNFGCTHMIIGRDHAGVGSYYGPYDAQKIFRNFSPQELGIEIINFEDASFCNSCADVVIGGACGHPASEREPITGTRIREDLLNNSPKLEKLIRPEILEYLRKNKGNLFS
jgi:sulfate adenylyltransferase